MEQIWKEGRELFSGCTHGTVIDILTAFYHIDMAEASKPYIGFEWLEKFYWYSCLPMGINLASFIYTKITKPMVQYWRQLGIVELYPLPITVDLTSADVLLQQAIIIQI